MITKRLVIGSLLLSVLIINGCSKCSGDNKEAEQIRQSQILEKARSQGYSALADQQQSSKQKDGYQGLIRIFSRHYLLGTNIKDKESKADYVVHGAGGLFSFNGKLYVLTAKHVVIPNSQIKEIKISDKGDPITFKNISLIQSEIIIGGLSVQPSTIIVSMNEDFCVMSIDDKDKPLVLKAYSKDRQAPLPIKTLTNFENISGMKVEVWGFPAQHNPQVERVLVSVSNDKFISLNKALLRGYSGGPVFLIEQGKPQKDFVGIITRADEKANQSTVLSVSQFGQVFKALLENQTLSDVAYVKRGGEASINDAKYKFLNYYN